MKIIHNTDIKQVTFLDERFYFHEESQTYYPSATTILDVYPKGYGFQQWLKDLGSNADEVLRRAGEQGTRVHSAIETFLKGGTLEWIQGEKDNYTLDEWMMICRFMDFYKNFKPRVIAIEESLVSPDLGFGGTLDLVCEINGTTWYLDYKSGNAIYKSHKIQGAAYQRLWNAQRQEKIERVGCLHLRALTRGADKTGKTIQGEKWKVDEAEDNAKFFTLFEHAQAIWKEENPNPQPKNMIYPSKFELKDFEEGKGE